jgi:hypothetical protein
MSDLEDVMSTLETLMANPPEILYAPYQQNAVLVRSIGFRLLLKIFLAKF